MQVEHDKSSFNNPPDVALLFRSLIADEWMPKTGLGGLFAGAAIIAILFNFICLPIFAGLWALTIGYCLRCIRLKVADPKSKLPEWNDWGDLFMSGITWLALQTGVWSFSAFINFIVMTFCFTNAMTDKSSGLSFAWSIFGCLFALLSSAIVTLYSSYLMVNFAIEENVKGGVDIARVSSVLFTAPQKLLTGFVLAIGIQWLFTIVPTATIIGVIFAPQMYFASQLISALILAQHWTEAQ